MSTYLQLVTDLSTEVGVDPAPTSVTGQIGELARLVKWTRDAYNEIQGKTNWRWLRRSFTFNTTSTVDSYAPGVITDVDASGLITRFSSWRIEDIEDAPKIFLTSAGVGGQSWMTYLPFEYFKQLYDIGSQQDSRPVHITKDPQDNIRLGPTPDDIYTVRGEFIRSDQILTANGDIPEMPTQFHQFIVYRAMEKYGSFESAQEVLFRGQNEGERLLKQLEKNQGAVWRRRGPMV